MAERNKWIEPKWVIRYGSEPTFGGCLRVSDHDDCPVYSSSDDDVIEFDTEGAATAYKNEHGIELGYVCQVDIHTNWHTPLGVKRHVVYRNPVPRPEHQFRYPSSGATAVIPEGASIPLDTRTTSELIDTWQEKTITLE